MIKQFTSYAAIEWLKMNEVFIVGKPKSGYDICRYLGKNNAGKNTIAYMALSILELQDAVNIAETYAGFRINTKPSKCSN